MGGWKDGDTEAGKPERPEGPGRISIQTSGVDSSRDTGKVPEEKRQFLHSGSVYRHHFLLKSLQPRSQQPVIRRSCRRRKS